MNEIDALIERAGRLTVAEIAALDDAEVAARAAARRAARVAVEDEAWDAAQDAARAAGRAEVADAAEDAAWDAVRVAARVPGRAAAPYEAWAAGRAAGRAAVALVVRDLIDEDTPWNRAAYDVLTGPWRRVIGPVHPDDEPSR